MLRTLARRAAHQAAEATQSQKPAQTYLERMIALHPPKKVWPPDFNRLSPEERLGLEKRYKRRTALATAKPRWIKFTKMAQLFSIMFVLIYSILFMDWKDENQPFDEVRKMFWNALGADYDPPKRPIKTAILPHARS